MLTITNLKKYETGQWHSDHLESIPEKISEDSILWIDAQDPTEEEIANLRSHFELEDLNLREFDEEGLRSKIEEVEDRVSCFVSFPSREHFLTEVKTDWLALFVSKRWMISVHRGYSDITCEIYKKISTHGYCISAFAFNWHFDIHFLRFDYE